MLNRKKNIRMRRFSCCDMRTRISSHRTRGLPSQDLNLWLTDMARHAEMRLSETGNRWHGWTEAVSDWNTIKKPSVHRRCNRRKS